MTPQKNPTSWLRSLVIFYTTAGDILDQKIINNRKQEQVPGRGHIKGLSRWTSLWKHTRPV